MSRGDQVSIGLIWAQFAAYHVDRCEALARQLGERATVRAIEVATTSADYAWEPSGNIGGVEKVTLFHGQSFDAIPPLRRFAAMFRATRGCKVVCMGLSYGLIDAILLSWTLRLLGCRVIVFSDSKFDDRPRSLALEWLKSLLLGCYCAAIVAGRRHRDYFRFLGFRKRPVLPGYDGVEIERIRRQSGTAIAPAGSPFEQRPFLFVGRFVGKKNLFTLLRAYALYAAKAPTPARRLVLAGSGPDETALRQLAEQLGISSRIDFPGFLAAEAVSQQLGQALALVLVSREEQWGLVVNEALALGLPVIVSHEIGSRDLLVRNLVNGFVVESNSAEGIANAMLALGADRKQWEAMAAASCERAWMGDAGRLADAIELLLFPASPEARNRLTRLEAELEIEAG